MFPSLRRDVLFPSIGGLILTAILIGGGLAYATTSRSADRLITAMLIDAIMVIGLQIYIGNTGVLSFGHIGFGAVAGYVFAIFAIDPERKQGVIADAPWGLDEVQLSPTLSVIVAVAITVAVAVIIGLGLARSGAKSGAVAATVITLALLLVAHAVAINWYQVTGGDRAGLAFSIGSTLGSKWPIIVTLVVVVIGARLFAQSRSGRLAQAAREDNLAARAMGINPSVQQMIALLLSVAVVAIAASFRVYEIGNITPRFFYLEYTLLTLVMLIVGGRNSVTGALVGVVLITIGREIARIMSGDGYTFLGLDFDAAWLDWIFREGLPTIFLGLAMLGFMIRRPNGLLNDWELDEWLHHRFGRSADDPPAPSPVEPATTPAQLRADGLTVDFGGFRALNDASITVDQGTIVGLIGPNGAGKTTMVNVLTGMVDQSEGTFGVDDVDLSEAEAHTISRSGMVRTFQNLRLFTNLRVEENVEAAWLLSDAIDGDTLNGNRPEVATLLEAADLTDLADVRARELDYGTSRRLELARAAATGPTFFLLDEPTSGMSDVESIAMIDRVRAMAELVGAGVLVIDHDLNFITGVCDRIYCLDQGSIIAEGTPGEIQANPKVQAAYLGGG